MKLADSIATNWPSFWDTLPMKGTPAEVRELIEMVRKRDQLMLAALKNLRASSGIRAARRMQRRYLLSGSAKLEAMAGAWRSKVGSISDCTDDQIMSIMTMAADLFAWKAAPERALAWPKLKRDGERHRLIHKFQLRQTALDRLAANAGRSILDLLPTQFNRRGGGVERCEAWLTELMPKTQTVLTVDVPSYFDNISRSSVEVSLLLPRRVVEAVMFTPMDKAKRLSGVHTHIANEHDHDVVTGAVKRSVPQGSALAQLAADIEIDKVLRAVAAVHSSVHVAAIGDNLIFLLEDAGWLGSVKDALSFATTKLFGPDVTTALVYRIQCDKPPRFDFCRRRYYWTKGKLRKALPAGHVDDFVIKAMVRTQDAYKRKDMLGLENVESSIKGFLAQHFKVKGVVSTCAELLSNVNDYRKLVDKKALQGVT